MSTTRCTLRNRKTGDEFIVNSPTSLTRIRNQSFFAKSLDYSPVEEFLQQFATKLPKTISEDMKAKILIQLRQEYVEKNKEINSIISNPQAFTKLIFECRKQTAKAGFNADAISLPSFLKLLSTSLINAKLDTIFPGLAILASQVVASAAQPGYTYHEGQPVGGEDLCANALYECIQGYLTQEGQQWQNDLPQIAGLVEQNATNIDNCMTQQNLQNMLARAYKGPNEFAANCTITAPTNNGDTLMINATQVDPITCDIMKDSLIGYADHCPIPPTPTPTPHSTSHTGLYIGLGIAGGATLALLAFGMYKCVEFARQHDKSAQADKSQYTAI